MCYDKALRILARLEYPDPTTGGFFPSMGVAHPNSTAGWIDDLVDKKFSYVVSAQVRAIGTRGTTVAAHFYN